jgi:hypothetical protein
MEYYSSIGNELTVFIKYKEGGKLNVDFSEEEFKEIACIIGWAIDNGYNTNSITKILVRKFGFTEEEMKWLDENSNIGDKLM